MKPNTETSQEITSAKGEDFNADFTLAKESSQEGLQINYVEKIPEKKQAKESIYYLKRPEKLKNEKAATVAFIWLDEVVQFKIEDLADEKQTKLHICAIKNYLNLLKPFPFHLKSDNNSIKTGAYIEYGLCVSWIEFRLIEPFNMQKSFSQSYNELPQRPASLINTSPNPQELTKSFKAQIKAKIAQEEYNSKILTSSSSALENSSYSMEEYTTPSSYFYEMPILFGLLAGLAFGFANQSVISSTAMTTALTGVKIATFGLAISLPYLGIALAGLALAILAIVYCKRNNIGLEDIPNSLLKIIKKDLYCSIRESGETKNSSSTFFTVNTIEIKDRNNQLLNKESKKFL